MSYYKSGNLDISNLIYRGNTTFNNSYSGFWDASTTSNNWENPSPLGYQINGTDIANNVQAVYVDYATQSNSYSNPVPGWCTGLKIIAIGGGGGGGSGGANTNTLDAGCGGSGAGGSMAIIVSNSLPNTTNLSYTIIFTPGGAGGAYQDSIGDGGTTAQQGTSININFYDNFNKASGTIDVYGGGGGAGGPGTSNNNNDSYGGQNNIVYNNNEYPNNNSNGANAFDGGGTGNNTTVPYNASLNNFANYFNVTGNAGNAGAGGGNENVGVSGVVQNYNSNNDPPPLNLNIDYSNFQSNNEGFINNQPIPPVGQGGVGGWNSDNNNGYPGQQGGPALVRIYFLA